MTQLFHAGTLLAPDLATPLFQAPANSVPELMMTPLFPVPTISVPNHMVSGFPVPMISVPEHAVAVFPSPALPIQTVTNRRVVMIVTTPPRAVVVPTMIDDNGGDRADARRMVSTPRQTQEGDGTEQENQPHAILRQRSCLSA